LTVYLNLFFVAQLSEIQECFGIQTYGCFKEDICQLIVELK